MNKTMNDKRLRIALTLMQTMCILALAMGTTGALQLGLIGAIGVGVGFREELAIMFAGLFGLLTVITVAVCSYVAIIRFFGMLVRLKKERAFTEQNGRTLGSISRMGLTCAGTLAGGSAATFLSLLLPNVQEQGVLELLHSLLMISLPILVLAFMYLGVGLVCRALRGMLERAKALQDENDLTI